LYHQNDEICDHIENKETSNVYKPTFITNHVCEICISDIESIRQAIQGGANSIEICVDRSQGGVTPSIGLVRQAINLCKDSRVEVHVLVRPRPGYFTYTHEEFDVILRDVVAFQKAGVTGNIYCQLYNVESNCVLCFAIEPL